MFSKPIGQIPRAHGFNQLKEEALMDPPIQALVDDIID